MALLLSIDYSDVRCRFSTTLYIKLEAGQTPKGEVEKNYLLYYPTWRKKETSCKEIA
jgi:hypothetical protein